MEIRRYREKDHYGTELVVEKECKNCGGDFKIYPERAIGMMGQSREATIEEACKSEFCSDECEGENMDKDDKRFLDEYKNLLSTSPNTPLSLIHI